MLERGTPIWVYNDAPKGYGLINKSFNRYLSRTYWSEAPKSTQTATMALGCPQ